MNLYCLLMGAFLASLWLIPLSDIGEMTIYFGWGLQQ